MKVLASYTEVYEIDEDGNSRFYCWFLNPDGIHRQLAYLLLSLRRIQPYPIKNMDGSTTDPLKEAVEEVVWTGADPMPRAFVEHNGKVYFGHVREYQEIEKNTKRTF